MSAKNQWFLFRKDESRSFRHCTPARPRLRWGCARARWKLSRSHFRVMLRLCSLRSLCHLVVLFGLCSDSNLRHHWDFTFGACCPASQSKYILNVLEGFNPQSCSSPQLFPATEAGDFTTGGLNGLGSSFCTTAATWSTAVLADNLGWSLNITAGNLTASGFDDSDRIHLCQFSSFISSKIVLFFLPKSENWRSSHSRFCQPIQYSPLQRPWWRSNGSRDVIWTRGGWIRLILECRSRNVYRFRRWWLNRIFQGQDCCWWVKGAKDPWVDRITETQWHCVWDKESSNGGEYFLSVSSCTSRASPRNNLKVVQILVHSLNFSRLDGRQVENVCKQRCKSLIFDAASSLCVNSS